MQVFDWMRFNQTYSNCSKTSVDTRLFGSKANVHTPERLILQSLHLLRIAITFVLEEQVKKYFMPCKRKIQKPLKKQCRYHSWEMGWCVSV